MTVSVIGARDLTTVPEWSDDSGTPVAVDQCEAERPETPLTVVDVARLHLADAVLVFFLGQGFLASHPRRPWSVPHAASG